MAVTTVDVTEPTATVHAHAATAMDAMPAAAVTAAAMAAGKRVVGSKQRKAERSARSDGQQCRLPKHSVLLCDPLGIPLGIDESPIRALVGWLIQKVQEPPNAMLAVQIAARSVINKVQPVIGRGPRAGHERLVRVTELRTSGGSLG
jgi:hypothetical protein